MPERPVAEYFKRPSSRFLNTLLHELAHTARKAPIEEAEALRWADRIRWGLEGGDGTITPFRRHIAAQGLHIIGTVLKGEPPDRYEVADLAWTAMKLGDFYLMLGEDPYAEERHFALELMARMAKDLAQNVTPIPRPAGETFGSRLYLWRTRRNLTQLELANRIDVSPSAIYDWEHNKREPHRANLKALCKVLGCSEKDLTG